MAVWVYTDLVKVLLSALEFVWIEARYIEEYLNMEPTDGTSTHHEEWTARVVCGDIQSGMLPALL